MVDDIKPGYDKLILVDPILESLTSISGKLYEKSKGGEVDGKSPVLKLYEIINAINITYGDDREHQKLKSEEGIREKIRGIINTLGKRANQQCNESFMKAKSKMEGEHKYVMNLTSLPDLEFNLKISVEPGQETDTHNEGGMDDEKLLKAITDGITTEPIDIESLPEEEGNHDDYSHTEGKKIPAPRVDITSEFIPSKFSEISYREEQKEGLYTLQFLKDCNKDIIDQMKGILCEKGKGLYDEVDNWLETEGSGELEHESRFEKLKGCLSEDGYKELIYSRISVRISLIEMIKLKYCLRWNSLDDKEDLLKHLGLLKGFIGSITKKNNKYIEGLNDIQVAQGNLAEVNDAFTVLTNEIDGFEATLIGNESSPIIHTVEKLYYKTDDERHDELSILINENKKEQILEEIYGSYKNTPDQKTLTSNLEDIIGGIFKNITLSYRQLCYPYVTYYNFKLMQIMHETLTPETKKHIKKYTPFIIEKELLSESTKGLVKFAKDMNDTKIEKLKAKQERLKNIYGKYSQSEGGQDKILWEKVSEKVFGGTENNNIIRMNENAIKYFENYVCDTLVYQDTVDNIEELNDQEKTLHSKEYELSFVTSERNKILNNESLLIDKNRQIDTLKSEITLLKGVVSELKGKVSAGLPKNTEMQHYFKMEKDFNEYENEFEYLYFKILKIIPGELNQQEKEDNERIIKRIEGEFIKLHSNEKKVKNLYSSYKGVINILNNIKDNVLEWGKTANRNLYLAIQEGSINQINDIKKLKKKAQELNINLGEEGSLDEIRSKILEEISELSQCPPGQEYSIEEPIAEEEVVLQQPQLLLQDGVVGQNGGALKLSSLSDKYPNGMFKTFQNIYNDIESSCSVSKENRKDIGEAIQEFEAPEGILNKMEQFRTPGTIGTSTWTAQISNISDEKPEGVQLISKVYDEKFNNEVGGFCNKYGGSKLRSAFKECGEKWKINTLWTLFDKCGNIKMEEHLNNSMLHNNIATQMGTTINLMQRRLRGLLGGAAVTTPLILEKLCKLIITTPYYALLIPGRYIRDLMLRDLRYRKGTILMKRSIKAGWEGVLKLVETFGNMTKFVSRLMVDMKNGISKLPGKFGSLIRKLKADINLKGKIKKLKQKLWSKDVDGEIKYVLIGKAYITFMQAGRNAFKAIGSGLVSFGKGTLALGKSGVKGIGKGTMALGKGTLTLGSRGVRGIGKGTMVLGKGVASAVKYPFKKMSNMSNPFQGAGKTFEGMFRELRKVNIFGMVIPPLPVDVNKYIDNSLVEDEFRTIFKDIQTLLYTFVSYTPEEDERKEQYIAFHKSLYNLDIHQRFKKVSTSGKITNLRKIIEKEEEYNALLDDYLRGLEEYDEEEIESYRTMYSSLVENAKKMVDYYSNVSRMEEEFNARKGRLIMDKNVFVDGIKQKWNQGKLEELKKMGFKDSNEWKEMMEIKGKGSAYRTLFDVLQIGTKDRIQKIKYFNEVFDILVISDLAEIYERDSEEGGIIDLIMEKLTEVIEEREGDVDIESDDDSISSISIMVESDYLSIIQKLHSLSKKKVEGHQKLTKKLEDTGNKFKGFFGNLGKKLDGASKQMELGNESIEKKLFRAQYKLDNIKKGEDESEEEFQVRKIDLQEKVDDLIKQKAEINRKGKSLNQGIQRLKQLQEEDISLDQQLVLLTTQLKKLEASGEPEGDAEKYSYVVELQGIKDKIKGISLKISENKEQQKKAVQEVGAQVDSLSIPSVDDSNEGDVVPQPTQPRPQLRPDPKRVKWERDPVSNVRMIQGRNVLSNVLDSKDYERFEKIDKELKSLKEFHLPKIKEEFTKLRKKERVFNYQRSVTKEVKSYHEDVSKLINDLMWLKGNLVSVFEDTRELIVNNKTKGGAGSETRNKDPMDVLKYNMKLSDSYRKDIEEMINELENIVLKLNNRYGIGKGTKSKDIRYYEETLKRLKNITDYDSSSYINACKQVKRFIPYNKELSGYDDISKQIEEAQRKCRDVAKKKDEEEKKKKEKSEEEKKTKKKYEKEMDAMKKELQKAQKQPPPSPEPRTQAPTPQIQAPSPGQPDRPRTVTPVAAPGPGTPPAPGPGTPPEPGPGTPEEPGPGKPPTPGTPSTEGEDKSIAPVPGAPGKKPSDLNMEKTVDSKLMDISKKQGSELVIPPKEKLNELSKVMNNDKFVDIIRNKNFSEFTDKEIKDVDIVRGRFNSFVNDYYELLDTFYNYKKNKERGEKDDVVLLLKQEKQIESLKDIVLEYKTNLEKFRLACENKVDERGIEKDKEMKQKEKEFKDVFQYMQVLFKEELKEEKKATRTNTKILREENELQKEKILLLEDKKREVKKKRTPKKNKPGKKKTPKKERQRTPKKERQRTPKKDKKKSTKRTPKKGK